MNDANQTYLTKIHQLYNNKPQSLWLIKFSPYLAYLFCALHFVQPIKMQLLINNIVGFCYTIAALIHGYHYMPMIHPHSIRIHVIKYSIFSDDWYKFVCNWVAHFVCVLFFLVLVPKFPAQNYGGQQRWRFSLSLANHGAGMAVSAGQTIE